MAIKTFVIDGTDREHFFLAVDGDVLRVGDTPAHPEGAVRNLRVRRIRCEVEVDDDHDATRVDGADGAADRELVPGVALQLGHARLTLHAPPSVSDDTVVSRPVATTARRLRVIDGADQGQTFALPPTGTVTLGKSGRHVDIGLNDFYVARIHCALDVSGDAVTVTHLVGQNGTLVDGRRIDQPQVLAPGGLLRVGNSHLRLEVGVFADEPPRPEPAPSANGEGTKVARPLAEPVKTGEPLTQLEGQTFGNYVLGPLLGRGFTGAVYRATNTKTDQPAALKVLAAEFPASADELEHFAQELRAVHPVRHPHLVTPLGAGKSGAHWWVAREFVDGSSVAEVVARVGDGEKPSWTRAARVAVHLARALECLHEHRLVHGNITPRNVLIRDADHAALLTDLRLAEALAGSQLARTVRKKKLAADLPYLAPEQSEAGAFVDDSADLYAVGAVAYALIAGRPPVTGHAPADILEQIRSGKVTRPALLYRKVPPAFDALIMKLLAWHQEDRYPTAAALLADLEPIAEAHNVTV